MSKPTSSGIQTLSDGQAFIPSSKRADGSTRKEIKIRPGYKPPEDVETYKSRSAETWRTRGGGGVSGADSVSNVTEQNEATTKSKNAKRREAARKKKELSQEDLLDDVEQAVGDLSVQHSGIATDGLTPATATQTVQSDVDQERQKKIRNQLKKLKAIHELKVKKSAGVKLSAEQLVKISKESELLKDLKKLEYSGPELEEYVGAASL